MSASVILGVRLQPNHYQRIKVDNISLENKVESLKDEAAKKINVQKQNIELIYCGVILDDDSSLASCGVKPGVTIHVLEKKIPPTPIKVRPMTEADVQQLVVAFRAFSLSTGYRTALQRLSRPEILENIIVATPGLADDPIAIAMIRDPELIVQMSDPDTVRRIAELHPSLIEAAHHIAAHVHEEASNVSHNQAGTSTGYSYSLDALSDDEDMESPNESPQEPTPLTRNSSYNAITAAQLAAAIANATTASTFGLSSSPANNMSSTPTTSGNIITSEMFGNALQQAFASSQSLSPATTNPTTTFASPTTTPRNIGETFEAMTRRLQPQIQQMREMGLINEAVNIRALQTTSGDVQAAIELVLSGAFE